MAYRHFRILLIGVIASMLVRSAIAQSPSDRLEPERGRPKVCLNSELVKAMRIIDQACSDSGCDFSTIGELNSAVDKSTLFAALRDPHLHPVHIFFPSGEADVTRAFDWSTIKQHQLESLRYVDDPTNTIVFVLGHASTGGSSDVNMRLARMRMASVMSYIQDVLRIKCRQFNGAWLPEHTLELSESDAKLLNIPGADYRHNALVLNQVVHIFIFPCADLL